MFDTAGKSQGLVALPKEVFGQKPNEKLLSQALRVYEANISVRGAHTKTRSEVRGGGAKPWRQKGTGRARAGSRRSPLWVGGGIALGPRVRETKLSLPKKMKKKALIYALSASLAKGSICVISNLEKIEPKTKIVAGLLKKLDKKGQTLLVVSGKNSTSQVKLASRNIPQVSVDLSRNINPYQIMKSRSILFSKESIEDLSQGARK